jgi:predicted AlkP superfamily phosphohydrolase/phosphomutase
MLNRLRLRPARRPRVLVFGLDCASPDLIFREFRDDLPTLRLLIDSGTWGELESCTPCITVPAWTVMLSSRDPGVIGVYGFRNRADHGYGEMATADNRSIRVKRLWDYVGDAGRESVVIGVPPTYPVRPINGHLLSCFLTPDASAAFAHPPLLKTEVLTRSPGYRFDVRDFRTEDKARLHRDLLDMTETQFDVALHLLRTKPWDCFIYVNIGLDRVHHGFWRYHDPQHRLHDPHSPFRHVIRDYYKQMDAYAARLIESADDAVVLIVSDHGVKRMDGGVCLNEYLWRAGWLALRTPPREGKMTRFEDADIDWSRTRAWASGGYYGRVFLNIAGREPSGVIAAADAAAVKRDLTALLLALPDANGGRLPMQVFDPNAIYQQVNGIAPDLLVYPGDLHWRAVGSFGHGGHLTLENDTGPDDANHAQQGMYILYDPKRRGRGRHDAGIMDIAPTLLDRLGIAPDPTMQGRVIP